MIFNLICYAHLRNYIIPNYAYQAQTKEFCDTVLLWHPKWKQQARNLLNEAGGK